MRVSELIDKLEAIRDKEGDIEVELPDGTLMRKIDVVTVKSARRMMRANASPVLQGRSYHSKDHEWVPDCPLIPKCEPL